MLSDRFLKSMALLLLLRQSEQYPNFKLVKDITYFRNILFDCFIVDVETTYLAECHSVLPT